MLQYIRVFEKIFSRKQALKQKYSNLASGYKSLSWQLIFIVIFLNHLSVSSVALSYKVKHANLVNIHYFWQEGLKQSLRKLGFNGVESKRLYILKTRKKQQ